MAVKYSQREVDRLSGIITGAMMDCEQLEFLYVSLLSLLTLEIS